MANNIKWEFALLLCLTFALSKAQTKIIAHRGYSSLAPENTLAAFQKAIDCKADFLELDVHRSKDDSIVVIHDTSIDRTSSYKMKGKVSDLTYGELTQVKVGYPDKFGNQYLNEKIPTLREALLLAKDKIGVCIEIKTYGIESGVLEIVEELNMNEQVILFSFYYPVLAKTRKLDKQIPILYLKGKADQLTLDYAGVISANAIGVGSGTLLDNAYLNQAHELGMEVWQWTVNEEKQMHALLELGIDGIITDFPEKALQIRNSIQNESE